MLKLQFKFVITFAAFFYCSGEKLHHQLLPMIIFQRKEKSIFLVANVIAEACDYEH